MCISTTVLRHSPIYYTWCLLSSSLLSYSKLRLLLFNKTQKDIPWRDQLDECVKRSKGRWVVIRPTIFFKLYWRNGLLKNRVGTCTVQLTIFFPREYLQIFSNICEYSRLFANTRKYSQKFTQVTGMLNTAYMNHWNAKYNIAPSTAAINSLLLH